MSISALRLTRANSYSAAQRLHRRLERSAYPPGLLVVIIISGLALAIAWVERLIVGQAVVEAIVLALLIGVLVRNTFAQQRVAIFKSGADVSAKQILEIAVALLGASIYLPELVKAGPVLLGVVVGGVAASISVSYGLGRLLGLGDRLALLVAVGNSICGNSAIAAVAPVIGAEKRDVASAIGLTAAIGVCLVLGLPLLIAPFALSHYQYGVVAGMSVYAVPQVVAAAIPVSQLSGEVATLVKLTRVLLLGPVVLLISCLYSRSRSRGQELRPTRPVLSYVPWFVAVFLGLAAVRSLSLIPESIGSVTQEMSRVLMIIAMAGLGLGVDVASVSKVGVRVAAAVVGSLAFLAGFSVLAVRLANLQG